MLSLFKQWAFTHYFRVIAKAYFGTMSNMQVDALKEVPIPLINPNEYEKLAYLVQRKKTSPEKTQYNDVEWIKFSEAVGDSTIKSSHDDLLQTINWVIRNASRPGAIE